MSRMSQSSLLVSLCDKLNGINCIINDYNKIGKKLEKIISSHHRKQTGIISVYAKILKDI